ncbi:GAF and ANTAR domain-containing protein [Kocuria sp. M1R5S2]|uniref:GAF and ANTAR domain-containing protein n=1 Tax=Kocuria rhizosphaerae TaxID=3376285 RepID=UPI00379A5F1A
MNTAPSVAELTAAFARLQSTVRRPGSATSAVHQLGQVARELIDSAAGAGVSLRGEDGRKTTTAATDRVVEDADDLQYELGQGPCLSAWETVSPQRLEDTATDRQWPRWSAGALRLGVRSVLSTPLIYAGEPIGALQVYATRAGAFSADDERMLELLAQAAAILFGAARTPKTSPQPDRALETALTDRREIDMATGVLMGRSGIDEETARTRLMEASRSQDRTLVDIAHQVLDHGRTSTT